MTMSDSPSSYFEDPQEPSAVRTMPTSADRSTCMLVANQDNTDEEQDPEDVVANGEWLSYFP